MQCELEVPPTETEKELFEKVKEESSKLKHMNGLLRVVINEITNLMQTNKYCPAYKVIDSSLETMCGCGRGYASSFFENFPQVSSEIGLGEAIKAKTKLMHGVKEDAAEFLATAISFFATRKGVSMNEVITEVEKLSILDSTVAKTEKSIEKNNDKINSLEKQLPKLPSLDDFKF
jgi:hypothetical protein